MLDQQTIMDSLKGKGPELWRDYLRPFEEGQALTGLSMLVIFHHTVVRAKEQKSLAWAEVAVRAAELEAHHATGVPRENALLCAMELRAWFISEMGSRAGHRILDKEIILHWALPPSTLSLQATKENAASFWTRLKAAKVLQDFNAAEREIAEQITQLRQIKHRLNVVRMLADAGELPEGSPLHSWLEIHEQLP